MARIAGNQTSADRRESNDNYATDPRWTQVLIDFMDLPGVVWEPAAGDGQMVDVLRSNGYRVRATDITTGTDFLTSNRSADTIVTNPPYKELDQFIAQGLRKSRSVLALLVGWHFVAGGAARWAAVWGNTPPTDVVVVPQRMPVNGKASQFNHAWVVWDRGDPARQGTTELHWRSIK